MIHFVVFLSFRDHLGQWARKEMTARKDCQDLKDLLVLKERKDKLVH